MSCAFNGVVFWMGFVVCGERCLFPAAIQAIPCTNIELGVGLFAALAMYKLLLQE
jgi:uncharacterized membrane protein